VPELQPSASTLRKSAAHRKTTKKALLKLWLSQKHNSWNKIPMLMTMTSTPYPLAEKILMRRLLKKVLKILQVLKVPDWNTESIEVGTRLNTSWTCKKQQQELISRSCPNCPLLIRCPRCPNSMDKRLDSYNLLMQKSEQQPPYHLIGPLNYHVQWFAFWAFAYIKLIPLKLHNLLADWNVWRCK